MKIIEKFEILLDNSHTLDSALKTLGYALELINYVSDKDIREMTCHIIGGMECFQLYQEKITEQLEDLMHELKNVDQTNG